MSRNGNRPDTAPRTSLFRTHKVERTRNRVRAAGADARRALFACIEGF